MFKVAFSTFPISTNQPTVLLTERWTANQIWVLYKHYREFSVCKTMIPISTCPVAIFYSVLAELDIQADRDCPKWIYIVCNNIHYIHTCECSTNIELALKVSSSLFSFDLPTKSRYFPDVLLLLYINLANDFRVFCLPWLGKVELIWQIKSE